MYKRSYGKDDTNSVILEHEILQICSSFFDNFDREISNCIQTTLNTTRLSYSRFMITRSSIVTTCFNTMNWIYVKVSWGQECGGFTSKKFTYFTKPRYSDLHLLKIYIVKTNMITQFLKGKPVYLHLTLHELSVDYRWQQWVYSGVPHGAVLLELFACVPSGCLCLVSKIFRVMATKMDKKKGEMLHVCNTGLKSL